MQSLFNLTTGNLIQGFNFISKICAAELGEINILPTDRIITSAVDAEYFWERAKNGANVPMAIGILNAGYKRVYRTHFSEDPYSIINFRIYISNMGSKNSKYVSFLKETKFTKDQTMSINIVIPDLGYVTGDETISKDMRIYKIICNIFNYFLSINHDPFFYVMEAGTSTFDKSIIKYISKLSSVFTLMTGLFPEGFVPDNEMSEDLIDLSDDMFRTLTGRSREGHAIIKESEDLLLDYMFKISND